MTVGPDLHLDQRYGRRRSMTTTERYAVIVTALLLGTLVAYLVFRNSEQAIQSVDRDFQVTSPTTDLVTYEVHKPAAWSVTCTIRARDGDGAEVGRASVTIPPGKAVVTATFTLKTTQAAVTGEIENCAKS